MQGLLQHRRLVPQILLWVVRWALGLLNHCLQLTAPPPVGTVGEHCKKKCPSAAFPCGLILEPSALVHLIEQLADLSTSASVAM